MTALPSPCAGRDRVLAGASTVDARFSYRLWPPADDPADDPGDNPTGDSTDRVPLVIGVHGTDRDDLEIGTALAGLTSRAAVLAPLFPAELDGQHDPDNYKLLGSDRARDVNHDPARDDVRFDLVLWDLVDRASQQLGVAFGPVHLVGFSGGAQFVHRLLYLWPRRIGSASVIAPGRVTLIDATRTWWAGTADVEFVFDRRLDLAAIGDVPVLIAVGADDTEGWFGSRVAAAHRLHHNYREHGLDTRLRVVPGARHAFEPIVPAVTDFLTERLPRLGPAARSDPQRHHHKETEGKRRPS